MNTLLAGLVGVMLATNQLQASDGLVKQTTGASVPITNESSLESELDSLMAEDDAVLADVDGLIRTNNSLVAQGKGETPADLNKRIRARLEVVRNKYQDFLRRNPNYAPGHLAYGTFLDDIGQEDLAGAEFESATKLDPKNPAGWNNLANYYGEYSPVTNAFADYQKAIDLNPIEPVYYQNLATTVYLFRHDAEKFYGINETQVFDKSLALYRKAVQLDPTNFSLACDYAETYYGIKPLRTNDALEAWTNALAVAGNDFEREGVYIHLARIKIAAGELSEAAAHLAAVTNEMYSSLKDRLERNLAKKESPKAVAILPTNSLAENFVLTNSPENSSTNGIPAMTNLSSLEQETNSPTMNPTNLLEEMEISPPAPRALPKK